MVCDRVQIIDKGNLVFHGSIEDLKQQRLGNKLLIGFSKPPTISKLKNINFPKAYKIFSLVRVHPFYMLYPLLYKKIRV